LQRVVEIGPQAILSGLAKKTIRKKFPTHSTLRSPQTEVLSSATNSDSVYYEYAGDEILDSQPEGGTQGPSPPKEPLPPPPAPAVHVAVTDPAPVVQTAEILDAPLSAAPILLAILGRKLAQPFEAISMQSSIRQLSQGKSTIQNEIIGDLHGEFSRIPYDPENSTLEGLAIALDTSFNHELGQTTSKLLAKIVSAKMPAGFNQNAIADHLSSYWGLKKGRQAAILCLALTAEPQARISSLDLAREWLNEIVCRYGKYAKINLTPNVSAATKSLSQPTINDKSADREGGNSKLHEYLTKHSEMLAKLLHDDKNPPVLDASVETGEVQEVSQLLRWAEEFDDNFTDGVKPKFDTVKIRKYDSYWNWVRQDLLSMFQDPLQSDRLPDEWIQRILPRWTRDCQQLVHFYASRSNTLIKWKDLLSTGSLELDQSPRFKFTERPLAPKTTVRDTGEIEYSQVPRKATIGSPSYYQFIQHGRSKSQSQNKTPFIHLRRQVGNEWVYHSELTSFLMEVLAEGSSSGLTFAGKTVLITGAGPGSIGAEIVGGLLAGGAFVIVTTSSDTTAASKFYQTMYKSFGARGSNLVVLPYNAGSKKDTDSLIEHIYTNISSYADGLDFVIPFASIPERGLSLDGLDGKSELAHRAMLINVMRLLGNIKKHKEKSHLITRPTNVILPLSPNHGTFGGDGLYGESKIGLETLLNRWHSEDWAEYLTVCGAVIGWTRGTGLMESNDNTADAIESHEVGAVTFTTKEMAFNILSLMDSRVSALCEDGPVYADLTGGLNSIPNLKEIVSAARSDLLNESILLKALHDERAWQDEILNGGQLGQTGSRPIMASEKKRGTPRLNFPSLPTDHASIENITDLRGMIDLSRTVVVVGYSDLSPWGSARTRWEWESQHKFSLEGWIEMAWMMGLVKHFQGEIHGQPYAGWVDAKTKEPVADEDISKLYGDIILNHSGLRFIESESLGGYDPERKEFLHEVVIDDDLPPFETSSSEAQAFKLRHGDKALINPIQGSENFTVCLKKGAPFLIPKSVPFDRRVAGQLPKGWDPANYGIPKDIIAQVDPITIYALCCVSEALLSASINDPFELYEHMHVSEIANCLGTGAGGLLSVRAIYKERYLDKDVRGDVLQESYLNSLGAWTNMLLLGSAGPIRSPTGTCATAVESLDTGCEAIQAGKVKVAFVGGSDDFQEESSYEFSKMEATASSEEYTRAGRPPSEMSRPMTTSRHGFVESEGCGVQIIMNAEFALNLGLPIYAVVAHTSMAGDSIGRSVPAPGQGIMTAAREGANGRASPLLDLEYRRSNLKDEIAQIESWRRRKQEILSQSNSQSEQSRLAITATSQCRIRDVQNLWSYNIRKQNPDISPIRAALAVWGMTIDDLQVASLHGTSTKANDTNESSVIDQMMSHLGRSHGNPLMAVTQKYLTGHTKGASGALMFNGALQILGTGTVPGNRNADNIDPALKKFSHIVYPSTSMQTAEIKAFMLTSFGFGQKGGLVLAVAPKFLFGALTDSKYLAYRESTLRRQKAANVAFLEGLIGNSIFKAKSNPSWSKVGIAPVFLDPAARTVKDTHGAFAFDASNIHGKITTLESASTSHLASGVGSKQNNSDGLEIVSTNWLDEKLGSDSSINSGVDVEAIADVPWTNTNFVDRNFTVAEQVYCSQAPDPASSYAGRWTAKEAVFKSLQIPSSGAGASMHNISVEADARGIPRVNVRNSSFNH
jgi:fatty acid synthase subunit alpha, fungi type